MTDSPEQRSPVRMPDDIVEENGTVIAVVGDVHLEIDGMGRDDGDDDFDPIIGEDDDLGEEEAGDG